MPESRRDQRNFLPALALTVVWWLLLAGLVIFIDPEVVADLPFVGSYFIFFSLLFLAVWFLFSLLLVSSRRGFWVAAGVVVWGFLRLAKLGTWLNAVLLAGLLFAFEIYLSGKKPTTHTREELLSTE